jgi:hypothetical protein
MYQGTYIFMRWFSWELVSDRLELWESERASDEFLFLAMEKSTIF